MTTPEAILARIEHELDKQGELLERVNNLNFQKRIAFAVITLMFAVVVAGVGTLAYTIQRTRDTSIEACRDSNDRFDRVFDFIDLSIQSAEGNALLDGLRSIAVVDCDQNDDIGNDRTSQPTTAEE